MATETTTTKHCPGVVALEMPAHDSPATTEFFSANKGGKDGMSTRCRICGAAYGKAWAAAKKAGTKFGARTGVVAAEGQPAEATPEFEAQATAAAQQLEHPDGTPVFTGKASQVQQREAEDAAARLQASLRKGWTTEVVNGTAYALPTDTDEVGTPEGQAALELVNNARTAERRRRATEAKRAQRARAKAAANA